jgi:hypothetical protein
MARATEPNKRKAKIKVEKCVVDNILTDVEEG